MLTIQHEIAPAVAAREARCKPADGRHCRRRRSVQDPCGYLG
jgi:hypothetical protein